MKLHYRHNHGGSRLSAPSGREYDFAADEQGRRVADVDNPGDAAWFLAQKGHQGEDLFEQIDAEPEYAEWDPLRRNYDEVSRETLRELYALRFGQAAGNRAKRETLIEALKRMDEEETAAAEAEAKRAAELEAKQKAAEAEKAAPTPEFGDSLKQADSELAASPEPGDAKPEGEGEAKAEQEAADDGTAHGMEGVPLAELEPLTVADLIQQQDEEHEHAD